MSGSDVIDLTVPVSGSQSSSHLVKVPVVGVVINRKLRRQKGAAARASGKNPYRSGGAPVTNLGQINPYEDETALDIFPTPSRFLRQKPKGPTGTNEDAPPLPPRDESPPLPFRESLPDNRTNLKILVRLIETEMIPYSSAELRQRLRWTPEMASAKKAIDVIMKTASLSPLIALKNAPSPVIQQSAKVNQGAINRSALLFAEIALQHVLNGEDVDLTPEQAEIIRRSLAYWCDLYGRARRVSDKSVLEAGSKLVQSSRSVYPGGSHLILPPSLAIGSVFRNTLVEQPSGTDARNVKDNGYLSSEASLFSVFGRKTDLTLDDPFAAEPEIKRHTLSSLLIDMWEMLKNCVALRTDAEFQELKRNKLATVTGQIDKLLTQFNDQHIYRFGHSGGLELSWTGLIARVADAIFEQTHNRTSFSTVVLEDSLVDDLSAYLFRVLVRETGTYSDLGLEYEPTKPSMRTEAYDLQVLFVSAVGKFHLLAERLRDQRERIANGLPGSRFVRSEILNETIGAFTNRFVTDVRISQMPIKRALGLVVLDHVLESDDALANGPDGFEAWIKKNLTTEEKQLLATTLSYACFVRRHGELALRKQLEKKSNALLRTKDIDFIVQSLQTINVEEVFERASWPPGLVVKQQREQALSNFRTAYIEPVEQFPDMVDPGSGLVRSETERILDGMSVAELSSIVYLLVAAAEFIRHAKKKESGTLMQSGQRLTLEQCWSIAQGKAPDTNPVHAIVQSAAYGVATLSAKQRKAIADYAQNLPENHLQRTMEMHLGTFMPYGSGVDVIDRCRFQDSD